MRLIPGAPVLVRPGGAVQVGLAAPLVLSGLDIEEKRFVAALEDGSVTSADARRHASLLAPLQEAGLLDSDAPPTPRVRVHDHGPLGVAIVAALARLGCIAAFSPAPRSGHTTTTPSWRAGRAVRRLAPLWVSPPAEGPCDVEVVVGLGATPPVSVALGARDRPHVVVVVDERGATVGPAVIPGVTPCGNCADLRHCDDDPEWPLVALQCATRSPRVAAACVEPMAALAAAACRALVTDGEPVPGAPRWRVDTRGRVTPLPLVPHPDCRCGAFGSPGDDVAARRARMP